MFLIMGASNNSIFPQPLRRIKPNSAIFYKKWCLFPQKRMFEFVPELDGTDQSDIMHGKFDISISEPDILNHQWLNKPVTAKLHSVQIGRGKPRYTLKTLDDLSQQ